MMLASRPARDKSRQADSVVIHRGRMPMNDATTAALSPETVLHHMKQAGVTDVVWLPDSETTGSTF